MYTIWFTSDFLFYTTSYKNVSYILSYFKGDGENEEPSKRQHMDVGTRKVHEQTISDAGNLIKLD